ncbi:hypothetical protein BC940DRAFT_311225 [Gongronella butleri]|nr:hypothetical protein BC940DRAFT_311225 [Gongronella butleri]
MKNPNAPRRGRPRKNPLPDNQPKIDPLAPQKDPLAPQTDPLAPQKDPLAPQTPIDPLAPSEETPHAAESPLAPPMALSAITTTTKSPDVTLDASFASYPSASVSSDEPMTYEDSSQVDMLSASSPSGSEMAEISPIEPSPGHTDLLHQHQQESFAPPPPPLILHAPVTHIDQDAGAATL